MSKPLSLAVLACGLTACHAPAASYHPRLRAFTITTVPLLTKQLAKTYPFLTRDFQKVVRPRDGPVLIALGTQHAASGGGPAGPRVSLASKALAREMAR